MELLDETNRLLIDQTRNGLIALGGGVLPFREVFIFFFCDNFLISKSF